MMHSHIGINIPEINCFDVLILVVMDDALALQCFDIPVSEISVLILVVMDDALALVFISLFSVTAIMS